MITLDQWKDLIHKVDSAIEGDEISFETFKLIMKRIYNMKKTAPKRS